MILKKTQPKLDFYVSVTWMGITEMDQIGLENAACESS